jgi:pimeloyl-ACP methyl ester carboxylesterase
VHQDWGELDAEWTGVRSQLIELRGTSVHVLRAEGRRAGPTQLLVHGLGGSATNWLEVIGGLAEHGPVVAPDLPGFGRTEPPRRGGSRIRANLGFLRAFVQHLGIGEAVVHGNSMGGMLAVMLAEAEPLLVDHLVLADPALPGPRSKLRQMHPTTVRMFAPFVVPGLGARHVEKLYAESSAEQLYEDRQAQIHADPGQIREPLRNVGIENVAYAQRTPWRQEGIVAATESVIATLASARRLWRAVDAVTAPTLVVWGDQDRLIGRPVIDAVVERRPDWHLHVMPGVGHAPMVEDPAGYLAVVGAFLDGAAMRRGADSDHDDGLSSALRGR